MLLATATLPPCLARTDPVSAGQVQGVRTICAQTRFRQLLVNRACTTRLVARASVVKANSQTHCYIFARNSPSRDSVSRDGYPHMHVGFHGNRSVNYNTGEDRATFTLNRFSRQRQTLYFRPLLVCPRANAAICHLSSGVMPLGSRAIARATSPLTPGPQARLRQLLPG